MHFRNTKYAYITSLNRQSGSPSNFCVSIHPNLIRACDSEYIRINVESLTINRNWNEVVSGTNNTLTFTDEADNETTFTIPEGNYSVYTLKDELNSMLDGKYTVTYNAASNKYTFTPVNNDYKLSTPNSGQFLGIINDINNTGVFTSSYPINLTYFNTIYLNCDLGSTEASIDNIKQVIPDSSTILARIPITSAQYSNINYTNLTKDEGIKVPSQNVNSLRFWLTTDKNTIVETNSDFDFCLRIQFLTPTPNKILA